jgi:hypothetical protein
MMSESTPVTESAQPPVRPFPWFCPRCRQKQVRRVTIPYECARVYNGQPITIVVEQLSVPRCDNCGELVFDYLAEEQINDAFRAQSSNAAKTKNGSISEQQKGTEVAQAPEKT